MSRRLITDPEQVALHRSVHAAAAEGPGDSFVELGTRHAQTSLWLYKKLQRLKPKGFRQFGVDFSATAERKWKEVFRRSRPGPTFVKMDTVNAAVDVPMGDLAWVFVDACHCFSCASQDILCWGARLDVGAYLVVHDTTERRKDYTKNFQHYDPDSKVATRPFGVWQAVKPTAPAGSYLRMFFDLIEEVDSKNGIQVWRKGKDDL